MSNHHSSDLTQLLQQAHRGLIEPTPFMEQLLQCQVFMPVTDAEGATGETTPIGFQKSDRALPLLLQSEEGTKVMVLFSDPERSKSFLQHYPDYRGGFITEFPWVLERIGSGMGITINPDDEAGIDLDPDDIRQLVTTLQPPAE